MPILQSTNPYVVLILGALLLLIGGGSGAFIVQFRKDRRLGRVDDVALLDEVRKVAREEVAHVARQLRAERRRTERLEGRIEQLTEVLRAHDWPIPAWKPLRQDEEE